MKKFNLFFIVLSMTFSITGCSDIASTQNIEQINTETLIENFETVNTENIDEKSEEDINMIRVSNLSKQLTNLEHEKEDAKSTVYFTKDISASGMVKIYDVLNSEINDNEKLGTKVAVKLSTGEAGNTHYLHPELIFDLVKKVNGTIVECNTAYGGKRSTTKEHMKVAEDHGFTKIAKVDIMDDKGEFSIPVNGNCEILNKDIVGESLKNYDSMLCLSHFKGHQMGGFGGAIKNMSIGVASPNGKANIHSAGKIETVENLWSNVNDQVGFEKAMAEAADSVRNYLNKKVIYINVMNNISIDCDCNGNPAKPDMHDVGILASTDPVALDQACVDIVYNTDRKESQTLIDRIEKLQGHIQLEHSEKIGSGNRNYKLKNIDNESILNNVTSDNFENNKTNPLVTMKMSIDNKFVPVIWENNNTIKELINDLENNDITINLSMYSNNEQVGSLNKTYTSKDEQITTECGDIVLYNSSNIVLLYGSNKWAYTKLGKIDMPNEDVIKLLGNGDVTLKLSKSKY